MEKPAKHAMLSVGLSIALANTVIILPVNAQSSADSYLPPEVLPLNQSMTYTPASTSVKSISNLLPGSNTAASNVPGMLSQVTQQQNFQTPQEARQAIYDSWANNKIFSQSNGQTSYNEGINSINNLSNQSISNQNMPYGQVQNLGQRMPQNFDNQMDLTANNPSPPQTQMLSGNVNTQSTSQQRTSGGISHAAGLFGGLAMGAFCLAGMRSPGGIYSAGLLGAGTANYAVNNGFRF